MRTIDVEGNQEMRTGLFIKVVMASRTMKINRSRRSTCVARPHDTTRAARYCSEGRSAIAPHQKKQAAGKCASFFIHAHTSDFRLPLSPALLIVVGLVLLLCGTAKANVCMVLIDIDNVSSGKSIDAICLMK